MDTSKRRLQWALGILVALPVMTATQEILRGAQGVPGGSAAVAPTVDNSLRYANVFKFAVGPVIWSHLAHVERSGVISSATTVIAVGGLARLLSWARVGRPHPVTIAATILEVVQLPMVITWRRRIRTNSGAR